MRPENPPEHVLLLKNGSSSVIWTQFGFKPDDHKQEQTRDAVYLQVVAAPQTNKINCIVTITAKNQTLELLLLSETSSKPKVKTNVWAYNVKFNSSVSLNKDK